MKIHTVIRIIDKRLGPWIYWESECGVPGHTNSNNCDCQVPANWAFAFDVHDIWHEMNKSWPYY